MDVGAGMTRYGRVVAPDLPGFGRSPLAGRTASVQGQASFLAEFIQAHTDRPAVIAGNSMGAVAAMLLAGGPARAGGAAGSPRPARPLLGPAVPPPRLGDDAPALHDPRPQPGVDLLGVQGRGARTADQRSAEPADRQRADFPGRQTGCTSPRANERCQMPWLPQTQFTAFRSIFRLMTPPSKYDRMVMKVSGADPAAPWNGRRRGSLQGHPAAVPHPARLDLRPYHRRRPCGHAGNPPPLLGPDRRIPRSRGRGALFRLIPASAPADRIAHPAISLGGQPGRRRKKKQKMADRVPDGRTFEQIAFRAHQRCSTVEEAVTAALREAILIGVFHPGKGCARSIWPTCWRSLGPR